MMARGSLKKMALTAVAVAALALPVATQAATFAVQANDNRTFGTVNLNTGVFTQTGISSVVYSEFGVSGGNLYSGAFLGSGFYKINPANGAGTLLGSTGIVNEVTGSSSAGVFELARDGRLYGINTANGAATLIGQTNIPVNGTISSSNGFANLFISHNDQIFQINTSNAHATLVSSTGPLVFYAMTQIGGIGWGVSSTNRIATFTPGGITTPGVFESGTTGLAYAIAGIPGAGVGAVPEPATWALMLAGFGLVGVALRRRQAVRVSFV